MTRERIESEVAAPPRLIQWQGREVNVPFRCRRVWDCLTGESAAPPAVLMTGAWRVKDVIFTTGHPCDERKLRELVALNPDAFDVREHRSHSGNSYNTYRLIPAKNTEVAHRGQGQLFVYMEARI